MIAVRPSPLTLHAGGLMLLMSFLTMHVYDYINVFQEGNLETSTGNPKPSTAWNDASEVQFELTPCEAYGPVTLSPHAR